MKHITLLSLAFIFTVQLYGQQVEIIKDSLDHPIDMVFVGDNAYVVLAGQDFNNGKIITFSVEDTSEPTTVLFDNITQYPRSIAERDSVLYVGLTESIQMIDLKVTPYTMEELDIPNESFFFPRSLLFVDDVLYIGEEEGVSQIDFKNPVLTKNWLIQNLEDRPLSLQYYDDELYIASDTLVYTYNLTSTDLKEVISDLERFSYSLLIVDNFLYLTQDLEFNTSAYIASCNLNDEILEPILFFDEIINPIGMREHDGEIYFSSPKPNFEGLFEGKILKLNTPTLSSTQDAVTATIEVYPNPTTDRIYINLESNTESKIQLFNSNGLLINTYENTNIINMNALSQGLYSIHVLDGSSRLLFTERIVKM